MILLATALVMVSVVFTGGRVRRLATFKVGASWLLVLALVLQYLTMSVFPDANLVLLKTLHLVSYVMAGTVVFLNRGVRGVPTIGLGGLLNGLAIAANAGTMPASPAAVATAGLSTSGAFANSAPVASPNLSFLGDVFAIPESWPVHNVFSVGDMVIVLGAAILLHFACGSRMARSRLVGRLCRWC